MQRRDGDRHFADRGEYALYLGPSEECPAHVVYLLSSRRVVTVAKVRVWEDSFPGIKGDRYVWFNSPSAPLSVAELGGAPASAVAPGGAGAAPGGAATQGGADDMPQPANTDDHTSTVTTSPSKHASPPPSPSQPLPSPPPFALLPPHSGSSDAPASQDDPSVSWEKRNRYIRREQPARSTRTVIAKFGKNAVLLLPPSPSAISHGHALATCAFVSAAAKHLACLPSAPLSPLAAFKCGTGDIDAAFACFDVSNEHSLVDSVIAAGQVYSVTITAELGEITVPKTYRQAINGPHASYWREAIDKEIGGLLALQTWDLVPAASMPAGSNLMHCHFVFAVKRKSDGSIEKFKARLVADGNTQKYGVDFDRIFATVVKTPTIRLVLIIAAARDYNCSSIDIRQAYLQAELKEDLYMRAPPGLWAFDAAKQSMVCKLRRSLYGLRQAGREWAVLFTTFLLK